MIYIQRQKHLKSGFRIDLICKKIGITLFASVFDIDTVKYLNKLKIPAFKIAKAKPIIMNFIAECVKPTNQ